MSDNKPILAVDVDGVISLFGFEQTPDQCRFEMVDGMMHCISLRAGLRLQRLAEHYDLVWATGWEDKANFYLPRLLGIGELPYLSFDGAARFGSAHWKLGPLEEHCRGRSLAWLDDNLDESCYEWARGRPEPTLLMPTRSEHGLQETETEALLAWAEGLESEG
jgi:hypothetical protein